MDLAMLEPITPRLIRIGAESLAKGRTCHTDMIVAEMVLACDDDVLKCLAEIYEVRLLNQCDDEDKELWKDFEVKLIQKVKSSTNVKDFRSIAIIPILFKLYFQIINLLAGGAVGQPAMDQYAYRKGNQVMEVVWIMRQLVEKGLEWGQMCTPSMSLPGPDLPEHPIREFAELFSELNPQCVVSFPVTF